MGKVIAKKISGMNGWVKGALVLTITLMISTFMYQGWFAPVISDSATNTYRFAVDTAAVDTGADGLTSTTALGTANPTTPVSKYSLTVSSAYTATGYIAVPGTATNGGTNDLAAMYGPVYSGNTVISSPAVRLAVRAGSTTAGQLTNFIAKVYDYDPSGSAGNGALIWTGNANGASTGTANLTLSFGTVGSYSISHGHRLKVLVSAVNASATAGRLYFYSSGTISSNLTVSETFPTSTTSVSNLTDYNGGNITGVTQGQSNIAMLSFQMATNATTSTIWTAGKLDKIGTNINLDDATFTIYKDSNNDGSFNPAVDQKISDEVSFTQASGQSYTLVTPQTITTTAQRYFVVYNLSPAAATSTTVGAQILDETYFTVSTNNMNPMTSGASSMLSIIANDGVAPVTKTYQIDYNSGTTFTAPLPAAGVTLSNTSCSTTSSTTAITTDVYGLLNYPNHTCTAPAITNYNTLGTTGSIILYFNGAGYLSDVAQITGKTLIIGAGGTGAIVNAHLFYVRADGTKVDFPTDANTGTAFGSTTVAARTLTFNAGNFVTNVPKGSRLGVKLTTSGASARISLNSNVGAKLVVDETPVVSNGVDVGDGKLIADSSITASTTGKVVDAFTMVAGSAQTVTSLTISGTNANSTNISAVTLYRKGAANTNYAAIEEGDAVIGTGIFSGTTSVVSTNESVGTSVKRYLVAYDISATAVVGQRITGLITAVGGATADVIADTSSAGLTVVASTVVTEGIGEPAAVTVGPGGAVTNLDAFGLYTNGPTDPINTVTVQLTGGTSGAVALMEIVDRTSGTVYGSSTAPISSDTWRMTVSGLSATSATTQCYVRITPKTTVTGTFYITGHVAAITHVQTGNALFYNDAASAIIAIDGIAPPETVLSALTGASPGLIHLNWSAVTDSNIYNAGINYKIVRGLVNSPAPADCSGTALYQGPFLNQGYDDNTGLVDGHSYTFGYRVCTIDGAGNRSTGAIASASAKLPQICNQTPTISFIDSPNQFTKTGGSADYRINIINNDIGDCPPVNFTISLVGTPNLTSFENPPTISPASLQLGPNGAGGNVKITVKSLASAEQGESESFTVQAVAPGYSATAPTPLATLVNNFGPMLHSSFSVGNKHGVWGIRSTCNDCHINPNEASSNIKLISENVLTPTGRRPVVFSKLSSSTALLGIFGNEQRTVLTKSTNVCEVCHHDTKFHQYSATKQQTARDHHNGSNCMVCHPHKKGFKYAGGAADCVSCHGNPPTKQVEMVSPPLNALGNNPTDFGAHAKHDRIQMSCDVCHNNYTRDPMGNSAIEMGFAIRSTTYRGFAGNVATGTVTISSSYNTLYNWASTSAGTTIVASPNQSVPSCTVYCHGWPGGGGTNPNPTWVGSSQAACGTCHNVTNAAPPASGSHLKHAASGQFLENGITVGGINMSCDKCHGAFKGYTSARHVNGSVAWDLSGIASNAYYKGSVAGSTGNLAPSSSFGSCSNLYCHSNIQGADGTGSPTVYNSPVWGDAAHCGSCHVDMYTSAAATGGHKQHAQPSPNFATPFDCRICHGNGGTTNPLNHANATINMEFGGYGANTVYSRGLNVAPGTAFGDCSNSDCHGRRTITWGASSALPLCDKCHGSQSSAGGFYTTSGPNTTVSNTDPIVGAHNAHIHQTNSAFTLYTSYSKAKDCSECHIKPNGPYDAGHIDTALPAEVTFQPGAIANRAIFYGISGAKPATYDSLARTCNNIWCHGAAMDSNVGRGAYATAVADGGTLGTPQTPTWNTPFLNGNPVNDCSRCHSYPPPAPNESYAHFSHYTSTNGVDLIAIPKRPNECSACHVNVKADGSGFINGVLHINGSVDKGCQACHGVPPNTQAELAIQSNGALASGQAGAHKPHADLPAIGKNCAVCHNGYTTQMPSLTMEMGFNAFGGKVTSGAFWGYSTVNNGLTTFVSSSNGTLVYQTNTQAEQNTCAVYCHGLNSAGAAIIGGRFNANAKPVWDSGASMVCGNCHGVNISSSLAYTSYTAAMHVRPPSAPTSSSHPKHAAPGALNITCDVCHGVITNFNHVNGSVSWKLDTANPLLSASAVYGPGGSQAASGTTGNLAPSASYGSCNNIYCHSSGQSGDGSSSIPNYANQQWGTGTLACAACHADMSNTGTGSHVFHTQATGGNYTCISCHGAGYTTTPGSITATTHVDKLINVASTAGYSKTSSFAPGTGYQTCTNICHGSGTPTWGTALYSSAQCQKCHADQNSPVFYSTSYPTQVTSATDNHVGVHSSHLQATHGIAGKVACASCHTSVINVNDVGHMDGSVGFNTANVLTYAAGNCTSTCHKGNSVSWTATGYFTGVKSHDCAMCHAIPAATAAHTQGIIDDYNSRGFAACVACHPHVNSDGSFNNASLHMNGAIDAISSGGGNCSSCHTTLTAMTSSTTSYHHVLASTSADYAGNTCLKCHADHDIFQAAQNAANNVGVSANLRVDNAVVPQVGDAPGSSYTNTDFVGGATNGGICTSCHNSRIGKNLTSQKYTSPFINTTTMAVTKVQYNPSMHNYTTSSTFSKDSSKFLANCSKCHSDTIAETKQSGSKTFGLHLSSTRELFTAFGAATPFEAREDRLCYGCHSQTNDVVDSGQTIKAANGKDWYGSRTMRPSAEDTFKSFSSATRVFRHNAGKYNKLHKADENQAYLGANKHVECADCHNSHGAQYGNHTQGNATLANVLQGVLGVTPSYTAAGAASPGLPGVSGTTLYFNSTVAPSVGLTTPQTTATLTGGTMTTVGMSNAAPSTTTPITKTISLGTTSSAYYGVDAFVSPTMTNGATLNAQIATLTMYAYYTLGTAPRLYAYAYLWNGTSKTALTTSTYVTLTASGTACTYTITIPQTTISNTNTVLVAEIYAQQRSTTANTVTLAYNATGTTGTTAGPSNLTFAAAPVVTWNSATSYTSGTATAEYQICFKCHSNANPNLASWGGTGAAAWTDLSMEFNPSNMSGHPILTNLNSYTNSVIPKPLTSGQMRAPWTNVGTQVMTCTDCHATDSAASKGPHGSSVKWMLVGTNKNWPYTTAANNGLSTGTLATMNTASTVTFCENCHDTSAAGHDSKGAWTGQTGSHRGVACVNCHIRVPHGGKTSRLITGANAPARYKPDGNGNGTISLGGITKWSSAPSKSNCYAPCSTGNHPQASQPVW